MTAGSKKNNSLDVTCMLIIIYILYIRETKYEYAFGIFFFIRDKMFLADFC